MLSSAHHRDGRLRIYVDQGLTTGQLPAGDCEIKTSNVRSVGVGSRSQTLPDKVPYVVPILQYQTWLYNGSRIIPVGSLPISYWCSSHITH